MGDQSLADRGHLKLELDQRRSEQLEQHVVGSLAVDHETSKPSLCSPCWIPALAATAAILLYSSAAFSPHPSSAFPPRLAVIIGVIPTSPAQAMHCGCFSLSVLMLK